MKVEFAQHCAWRAVYLSRMAPMVGANGTDYGPERHQFFHIGVDPNNGIKPQCFGGIVNPWNRNGWSFKWRFVLPYVRWKFANEKTLRGRVRLWAYSLSNRFWFSVDGRYTAKAKAARSKTY